MSGDDLKLNSLDRFRKASRRLVLEEHSHCEVPAGCGGAVLRWIDPTEALPLTVRLAAPGTPTLTLDGDGLRSARTTVTHGVHVFAFTLTCPEGGALLFHASPGEVVRSRPLRDPFTLTSIADGRWRATTRAPTEDLWRHPGYDDALWPALTESAVPAGWTGREAPWHIQQLLKVGARSLGLPRAETVWVRCRFDVVLAEAP